MRLAWRGGPSASASSWSGGPATPPEADRRKNDCGYAQPDDVSRAADAGFDAHLAKPPTIAEVQAVIARAPSRGLVPG